MVALQRLLLVVLTGLAQLASTSSSSVADSHSFSLVSVPPASSFATGFMEGLPECADFYIRRVFEASGCQFLDRQCICDDPAFFGNMKSGNSMGCSMIDSFSIKNATATACEFPIRDRFHEYAVISNVLGSISGFLVLLRLFLKLQKMRFRTQGTCLAVFMCDDYFALIFLCLGVANTVNNVYGIGANGLGRDIWTLSPDTIERFWRFFLALTIVYFLLVALLKLTMLAFYVQIDRHGQIIWYIMGTMLFVLIYGVMFAVVAGFQCDPPSYFWNKWREENVGKCVNLDALAWSNAIISIILDLWMTALPLSIIGGLQMNWKLKLGAALMFLLGTFVTVVSVIRFYYLVLFRSNDPNPTWDYMDMCTWSTIEINVGVMCISLPTVRIAIRRFHRYCRKKLRHLRRRFPSQVENAAIQLPSSQAGDAAMGPERDSMARTSRNPEVHVDGANSNIELASLRSYDGTRNATGSPRTSVGGIVSKRAAPFVTTGAEEADTSLTRFAEDPAGSSSASSTGDVHDTSADEAESLSTEATQVDLDA